ncbi:glycosyltransferase family 4 protein [Aquisalimonas lutea]|uniref:glycosyltransferase family 4 protein n=1 Tax=Aquisalimonas lutea TaxID=1327750 RepID=UPI0025B40578|nr:glycosyltransferase family 4 protein [Aquisalimonas lutea]MDN3517831.1 glycosyltransferase family 4 protein [Aquisalimonas lutea]
MVVNDPGFFLSHRLPVALAAQDAGCEVHVATGPGDDDAGRIAEAGLTHHEIPLGRSSVNPLKELRSLFALVGLFRRLRPAVVHLVTIKPVLYGGLAARLTHVPGMVAAISGMGFLFAEGRRGPGRLLAEQLYRMALAHPNGRVIVQNEGDRAALQAMGALPPGRDLLIPGSGVDLDIFAPTSFPHGVPIVVMPARMLWEKGVGEFAEAARMLGKKGVQARFALVGPPDPQNPSAVPLGMLEQWRANGPVEWWGQQDDMPSVLASASLVVLPSFYREGVPKALLEAAAAGRAIVTTDTVGCRVAVDPGVTGELVPARNSHALADTMERLLANPERLAQMGACGRAKAEAEFGVARVVEAHLRLYRDLLGDDAPSQISDARDRTR